ncbi:methyl-accepting chemotaxis protein [Thiomicrospira sp. R3]|uniref:methyl-accepting chemotaxis protein n=1 Tax=Thiomicrospira sp. R3 TaxID=3035472 RepID=UPI00259B0F24|nr:methyl-accepting chemotaxis protein [Thiomicrospira sp. R3]WFE68110.1 methyl-accepting chemotaxis protein [Thiomicrospira sp. R3]
MFCTKFKQQLKDQAQEIAEYRSVFNALNRASAVIEFDLSGKILTANKNFLSALGYSLEEIQGKHHRLFVFEAEANSVEYQRFWEKINRGDFFSKRFKRRTKSGEMIWIEASYNPVFDAGGKMYKVIKFATDITQQVNAELDAKAKIEAIDKVMAVIEFDPQGNIITFNENFSKTMGYSLAELKGKYHSVFVDKRFAKSAEYEQFWQDLRSGRFYQGTYQRFGKGDKEVWLEASYNTIKNADDEVVKVIKFATDIGSSPSTKLLDNVINDATSVIKSIQAGDLTAAMQNHIDPNKPSMFDKNIAQIIRSIGEMNAKLIEVISVALDTSISVSHSSAEVSQAVSTLNKTLQQQAAALEQTSSTMDQMNTAVQANTQNAQEVKAVALDVQRRASEGSSVMQQTISAMSVIQESSRKIANIVGLIDGIAFQTNLLALNAAVEAARAGDHGRGFAVVAGEVRALAQKSAEAAKDIKGLIEESVQRIDQGTALASKSGEMLSSINESIESVTQMVGQIANASSEQALGVSQVHEVINQIDQVTQQNAALVEKTTAAVEQSGVLRDQMAFFKTNRDQAVDLSPKEKPKSLDLVKANKQVSVATSQRLNVVKKSNDKGEWSEF